ncbi:hypothetical protein RUM44_013748 [Polyplax serrata]|uniref:Uncharacterized protein n=1 Tax=Polyplax serrata TaxID=468196 RepID=A0ABR1BH85_POLSC
MITKVEVLGVEKVVLFVQDLIKLRYNVKRREIQVQLTRYQVLLVPPKRLPKSKKKSTGRKGRGWTSDDVTNKRGQQERIATKEMEYERDELFSEEERSAQGKESIQNNQKRSNTILRNQKCRLRMRMCEYTCEEEVKETVMARPPRTRGLKWKPL